MVQHVRHKGREHVGAGQTPDIFDKLSNQHHSHVFGIQQTHQAAYDIEHKSHSRHIPFAELFGQGPHGENADSHGDAADDGHKGLGDAVIVGAQHIIAVVDQRHVLDIGAESIDEEIQDNDHPIPVCEHGFQLCGYGELFFGTVGSLLGDALPGEVVFQQGQRQGKERDHCHDGNPLCLVHAYGREDHHGKNQGHDDAGNHDAGYVVEDGEAAPLLRVPGGEGNHQTVAHVIDGQGKRVEQVIGEHDPKDLYGLASVWNRKKQDAGDCYQRGAEEQPGARLSLSGAGAVDNLPHNHIGHRIDDLADNGKQGQKGAAPDAGEL